MCFIMFLKIGLYLFLVLAIFFVIFRSLSRRVMTSMTQDLMLVSQLRTQVQPFA